MKQITITIPDDCEIQIIEQSKENKEDKKDNKIKTYQDLIDNKIMFNGYYIDIHSNAYRSCLITANKHNILYPSSEKVIKSMIAMAKISQLMPYYGGEVTDEGWKDIHKEKYIIANYKGDIIKYSWTTANYYFLAFHTEEQRNEFLKYNEQLVKDYLMID